MYFQTALDYLPERKLLRSRPSITIIPSHSRPIPRKFYLPNFNQTYSDLMYSDLIRFIENLATQIT